MSEKITIPSLIKWTGSKRSQAHSIFKLSPKYKNYFEPFLGGGSMMYLFSNPGSVGSDLYKPLIDLWLLVRDDPDKLINDYREKWIKLNDELDGIDLSTMSRGNGIPEFYYLVRDNFNKFNCPLDLNFLMRTCVNGIVRFNDRGEFNNSFHLSRRGMKPDSFSKNVMLWNKKIQKVNFLCADYREIISQAQKGDFVYLDPPYAATKNRYVSQLQPEQLFSELEKLNSRGVNWALSYDGRRGESDLTYNIPKNIFKNLYYIHSGNSAVKKVLSGPVERVEEALYTNY
jgi:DNA adenine methylase